ncbi:MAG: glycosyltransferase family 9 protein [Bdellovibrionales bacterium]
MKNNVQQVMWIRVGALGDLLVSLEALKLTCERFPLAKIWIVGSPLWLDLIDPAQWPQINGVLVCENGKTAQMFELSGTSEWVAVRGERSLADFAKNVQVTVNLRIESYRFSWFAWPQVPVRIGSSPWYMKWLYTHWFPWLGKEPEIHERDWYSLVAGADGSEESVPLPFPLIKSGLPALKRLNEMKLKSLWQLEKSKYILINPTSSRREKAWPSAQFRELCLRLKNQGTEVVVVGAPKETSWLQEVAGGDFRIIQPKTFMDLADLVGGAQFLVTNTSSLQFVAASMGTPTVTLMGLASPLRWGPLGPKDSTVCAEGDFHQISDLFELEREAYASIPLERVLAACRF